MHPQEGGKTDKNSLKIQNLSKVKQCPVTLVSDLGCEIKVLVTNKGAKMLVSDKVDVSGKE